jgi:hypothetical protein
MSEAATEDSLRPSPAGFHRSASGTDHAFTGGRNQTDPPGSKTKPIGERMKLLFFSTDRSEVELLRCECDRIGIPCEIHDNGIVEGLSLRPHDAELWLHRDGDCYRAVLLCFELGIGFAKRPQPTAEEPEDLAA